MDRWMDGRTDGRTVTCIHTYMHTYIHPLRTGVKWQTIYSCNIPCRVGLEVSVSSSHTVGRGFASRPGHTKDHHKNGTNPLIHLRCSPLRTVFL